MTRDAPHRLHGARFRRALLWGSCALPRRVQVATMPFWAALPFVALPSVRRQIARNLSRVLGPAPPGGDGARAYRVLLSFAQALADAYAVHGGGELARRTEVRAPERLEAARRGGRGVVLATGHVGLWQLGPYLLERAGFGPVVVAKARERDPGAHALEEALARRRGLRITYTDRPFASLDLLRTLREGGLVAVQIDRAPAGTAPGALGWAPFFGADAPFAAGPLALARAAETPILPVFLPACGSSTVRVEIGEPIWVPRTGAPRADLAPALATLAAAYETFVRAHPYQWYSFRDFWSAA
jgi:KDO2-lipid IV(A) lauroyltransferase